MTPQIGICLRSILTAALLATLAAMLPARAGEQPTLRALVSVDGPLVTLGDLIGGPAELADTALFRAPDPGTTGTVSAARVLKAAREHGVTPSADHLETITVTRTSRRITADNIADTISERLRAEARAANGAELEIRLDGFDETLHIEATASAPLELRSFDHDRSSGRFSAILAVADSRIAAGGIRVAGRAIEAIEVPVPVRAVRRGETIAPEDIALERVARRELRADTVRLPEEMVGQAARRSLRAGAPVSADSLMEPILVSRNDTVTIVYRVSGLTLTARGRAIAAGARGDMITVVNSQSNRTLEAQVARPGVVTVAASGNGALAAANR